MSPDRTTTLSKEYAESLDGRVTWGADSLITRLIERLAEYLWLHYPDARRLLITTDDVTGRAIPVQIIGEDRTPLWSIDASGWEPGGDNGPLHSLEPGDAADRHGARVHHDITLLGHLLPEGTDWATSEFPGYGVRSKTPGADWEIILPTSTDRLQYLDEVRLDKEARSKAWRNEQRAQKENDR